jgi:hypothetical protein
MLIERMQKKIGDLGGWRRGTVPGRSKCIPNVAPRECDDSCMYLYWGWPPMGWDQEKLSRLQIIMTDNGVLFVCRLILFIPNNLMRDHNHTLSVKRKNSLKLNNK